MGCLLALAVVCTTSLFAQESPRGAHDVTRIYVPTEDFAAIVSRDKQGVLLPKNEFAALLEQARRKARETPGLPDGIAVTGAEHRATIAGDQLVVTTSLELNQVVEGWRILSLPFRGIAVEGAKLDGKPALLARGPDNGPLHLFVDRRGTHRLVLELAAPLASQGGDRVAAFGLGGLPMGTFFVGVAAGDRLFVDEAEPERPAPIGKPADYKIHVGGRDEIRLRITQRGQGQEQGPERAVERLLFADTAYRLIVSPDDAAWQALTSLHVFGGAVERLTVNVPAGLRITEVVSTGLDLWTFSDETGQKPAVLTLAYRQPFRGSRTIAFKGILRGGTADQSHRLAVAALKIAGVTSHVGRIQLEAPADLRLKFDPSTAVRAGNAPLVFETWNEDFSLPFVADPKPRELLVNMLTALELSAGGLELQLAATLYGPLFQAELELPAEWTVTSVNVAGRPADWRSVSAEAGTHHLIVPVAPAVGAGKNVPFVLAARRVVSPWPIDETGTDVFLPEIRMLQAGVVVGSYVIKAADDFELTPSEVSGLDPAHLNLERERIGYRYQDTRFSGKLRIVRRPARLSAETVIVSRLDAAALRTDLSTTIESRGGGFRRLDIFLPESAGKDVRFQTNRTDVHIAEQRVAEAARGERLWMVLFDQYVKGTINLQAVIETPRQNAKEFRVPEPRFEGLSRQTGYVVVQTSPDQELHVTALGKDNQPLPDVDLVDLPPLAGIASERSVAAYRFVQPGSRITLTETKFTPVAVARGVCKSCEIETLLDGSGNWQHRARFHFVASGVQSLRVTMPEDAVVWSTLIDDRPAEVRLADGTYQLALPPASSPDVERALTVFYATAQTAKRPAADEHSPGGEPSGAVSGFRQSPPQVSIVGESGRPEPMEMLSRIWRLHYPEEIHVAESSGSFEPVQPLAAVSPLGRMIEDMGGSSTDQIVSKLLYAAAAVVLVVLCVTGYARFRSSGVVAAFAIVCMIGVAFLFFTQIVERRANQSATYFAESKSASQAIVPASVPRSADQNFNDVARKDVVGNITVQSPVPSSRSSTLRSDQGRTDDSVPGFASTSGKEIAGVPLMSSSTHAVQTKNATVGRFKGRPSAEFAGGGRLSVPIDFDVPPGDNVHEFRFVGREQAGKTTPLLDLRFENLQWDRILGLAIVAVVTVLLWTLRRVSAGNKSVLAALGLTLPLALVTVVPPSAQVWLDGIFGGTICGLFLWWIHIGVSRRTSETPAAGSVNPPTPTGAAAATTGAILVALTMGIQTASAADSTADAGRRPVPPAVAPRAVLLPYRPGQDPLSADRVFLDRKLFLELWNGAHPDQPIETRPPREAIVAGAIYSAKIVPGTPLPGATGPGAPRAAVTGRLVLQSFVDRPQTVTLPFRGVTLQRAQLDGQTAPIVTLPEGSRERSSESGFAVVLPKRGLYLLDVEFVVPARSTGPAGEFSLRLLPIASGRLTVEIQGDQIPHVRVTGAPAGFRTRRERGKTWIDVGVATASDLTIAWQPDQEPGSASRTVEAHSTTAVSIDDAGLHVQSRYRMHVAQGTVNELSFSLPGGAGAPDVKLQDVRGSDVAGWKIEAGEKKLVVTLRRAVSGDTRLELDLYRRLELGDSARLLEAPLPFARDVVRETGTVGLLAATQFDVQSGAVTGAARIEASQFPIAEFVKQAGQTPAPAPSPPSRPESAYRYTATPVRLEWLVARRRPEADVSALHAVVVGRRKLTLSSRFRITTTNAPVARQAIAIPTEFLPLAVEGTSVADWFVDEPAGGRKRLVVEFTAPQTGNVELVLNGTITRNPDEAHVTVDVPAVADVRRAEVRLAVWLDGAEQATIEQTGDWRGLALDQVPAESRSILKTVPQFAFQSSHPVPASLVLKVSRAEARLAGDSATIVTVTDTSVYYTLALRWSIAQAAADTFTLTVPDWLSGRLDFIDPQSVNSASPRLRQTVLAKLPGGRARWTITLEDPIRERFFLTATAVLPIPPDGKVASPSIEYEGETSVDGRRQLAPLGTQRHFVVLVNQSRAVLTPPLDSSGAFERVGRDEIPIAVDAGLLRQALLTARVVGKTANLCQIDHPAAQKGVPAFVNLADIVTVFEHDGTWRTRARYRVKNRSRQFLALDIPPDSQILSVYVGGKPSRPVAPGRADRQRHLVPLPAVSAADLAVEVRVVIAGRQAAGALPSGLCLMSEQRPLPVPQVVSLESDAEYGIPVARTEWTVYFPKDDAVSVVDDPKQTNVNPSGENETLLFERSATLDEMKQLVAVLAEGSSSRTRYQVRGNLRNLRTALDSQAHMGAPSAELNRVEGELNRRIQEEESKAAVEQSEQVARERGKDVGGEPFSPEGQADQAKSLFALNSPPAETSPDADSIGRMTGGIDSRIPFHQGSFSSPFDGQQFPLNLPNRPPASQGEVKKDAVRRQGAPAQSLEKQLKSGKETSDKGRVDLPTEEFIRPELTPAPARQAPVIAPPQLRTPGSLSLDFDIPIDGQKLVFTKAGGDPRLTVAILPHRSFEILLWIGWALVWGVLGLLVILALGRSRYRPAAVRRLPLVAAVVGALLFFAFPAPAAWIGLAILVIAVGIETVRRTRAAQPGTSARS